MEHKGHSAPSLVTEFPRLSEAEYGRLSSELDGIHIDPRSGRSSQSNMDSPLTLHGAPLLFSRTGASAGDTAQEPTPAGRIWSAAQRAVTRAVGEEDVPYLTLLILRLTRSVPGAQYLVHPRVVCVLGGVAAVGLAVAFTVLEKMVADDLEFHYPVFMQILVLALAALAVELLTGRHGLFVRSPPVQTAQLLPLVALYVLCVVLSHTARQLNSVHGTFQVIQALLPAVVVALTGTGVGARRAASSLHSPTLQRMSMSMARIRTLFGAAHGEQPAVRVRSASREGSYVSVSRLVGDMDDDGELYKSGYISGTSSAGSLGTPAGSDDSLSVASPQPCCPLGCTHSRRALSGRRLAVVSGLLVAVATWTPSFALVNSDNSALLSTPNASIVWCRSVLNIGLSLASVICNGVLLIAISGQLEQRPHHSSTAFVRNFAPLCMLAMLILWPLVEQPVDMLADLDTRRALSCLGVALLGALSWVARIAMLRAEVSDGLVGVATIMQIKPVVCLAVGWWMFGYVNWWVQVVAFFAACACLVCWCLLRLAVIEYPELMPVIAPHMYRSARSRKYSAAVV